MEKEEDGRILSNQGFQFVLEVGSYRFMCDNLIFYAFSLILSSLDLLNFLYLSSLQFQCYFLLMVKQISHQNLNS